MSWSASEHLVAGHSACACAVPVAWLAFLQHEGISSLPCASEPRHAKFSNRSKMPIKSCTLLSIPLVFSVRALLVPPFTLPPQCPQWHLGHVRNKVTSPLPLPNPLSRHLPFPFPSRLPSPQAIFFLALFLSSLSTLSTLERGYRGILTSDLRMVSITTAPLDSACVDPRLTCVSLVGVGGGGGRGCGLRIAILEK